MSFTLITLPAGMKPQSSGWELLTNDAVMESPLSGDVQILKRQGDRWATDLHFRNMSPADRQALDVVLEQLAQRTHLLKLPDFAYTRQGPGGGTPLVKGADQTGKSLNTDGWPNSTLVLKAGDRFEPGTNEVLVLDADVTSDGSGNATLTFTRPMRVSPDDNAAIESENPMALFWMPGGYAGSSKPPRLTSRSLSFVEWLHP